MEDNDITRGSGRGAGISINKVKGNKGGLSLLLSPHVTLQRL
ncbi:hypothetical protein MtrunA17_Chr7g0216031 [Medicago truncatula]|uniref:Uncharacterized protein n=1 Tax=Medicago truncatula TaxID=3880 RepID=A0A396GSN4_MEDTR|nr:hypothetical protein MtrunA17_Chr7g0216031 [Medicago truncatula]